MDDIFGLLAELLQRALLFKFFGNIFYQKSMLPHKVSWSPMLLLFNKVVTLFEMRLCNIAGLNETKKKNFK